MPMLLRTYLNRLSFHLQIGGPSLAVRCDQLYMLMRYCLATLFAHRIAVGYAASGTIE